MAKDVVMPALGMAQATGRLLRWLKADGEEVREGEALLEVETDKAVVSVEALGSGRLKVLRAADPEADVPVGAVVGVILGPGEEVPSAAPTAATAPTPTPQAPPAAAAVGAPAPPGRLRASPKARRLMRELGVAPEAFSGRGEPVRAADVLRAREVTGTPVRREAIRRRMAEATVEAWRSAPHFTLEAEVDAGELVRLRAALREALPGLTLTDLLLAALARTLIRHPAVNARWREGRPEPAEGADVGLAVATEDGLVVPVLRGLEGLTLAELSARRAETVARARSGALRPGEAEGGSLTLTNLGTHRVDRFQPVLNPGQVAILAVGRIAPRPYAVEGRLEARPTARLDLAVDHRALDGETAARFLDDLAGLLEAPWRLVLPAAGSGQRA